MFTKIIKYKVGEHFGEQLIYPCSTKCYCVYFVFLANHEYMTKYQ